MADDRGTDYVNERSRREQLARLPRLEKAWDLAHQLNMTLSECGYSEGQRKHLQYHCYDIIAWLTMTIGGIKNAGK